MSKNKMTLEQFREITRQKAEVLAKEKGISLLEATTRVLSELRGRMETKNKSTDI